MRAATNLSVLLAAHARKPSLPGSLRWAEGASKRRTRSSDSDEAVELFSEYSCFWLLAAWPSELLEKMHCGRHDFFFLRRHRRGMMYYGLQAWARLLPRLPAVEVRVLSPRSWSSTRPKNAKSCQAAPSVLSHRKHATSSWANSEIGFGFPSQKVFQTFSFFSFNSNTNCPEIGFLNDAACPDQSNPNWILTFFSKLDFFHR